MVQLNTVEFTLFDLGSSFKMIYYNCLTPWVKTQRSRHFFTTTAQSIVSFPSESSLLNHLCPSRMNNFLQRTGKQMEQIPLNPSVNDVQFIRLSGLFFKGHSSMVRNFDVLVRNKLNYMGNEKNIIVHGCFFSGVFLFLISYIWIYKLIIKLKNMKSITK